MGLRSNTQLKAVKDAPLNQEEALKQSFELPTRYEDDHRVELDVIERLKFNIAMLDDLQQRLKFMNDELENVIGSRK